MSYAELHCKTNFSFLVGASHADELFQRAHQLDYAALAVTDRNSLAGIVRAHVAAKAQSLKLIVGAEILPQDAWPLVLWAPDRAAYGRLSRLITVGRRQAPKGECILTKHDILSASEGLLAGILPPAHRASRGVDDPVSARQDCHDYRDAFRDRLYLLAEFHHGPADDARREQLRQLAQHVGLPLVAAGDVHYHVPARLPLHDVMTAIRQGTTVADLGRWRFTNAQRHLRSLADLQALYQGLPGAMERTAEIAERCQFSLDEFALRISRRTRSAWHDPSQYLRQLAWKGADSRYPEGIPDKVRRLLSMNCS